MKKRREFFKDVLGSALLLGTADTLGSIRLSAETKDNNLEYSVAGTFLDACSCNVPCPCEFSGSFKEGCHNIGVLVLTAGTYKGADLAGAKMVEAGLAGSWTHIFVDATEAQKEAAFALAKTAFSVYGKIESVKSASIDFSGKDGQYKLAVDSGRVLELTTEPVLGIDQKTPIILSNVPTAFGSTVMQAKSINGKFQDGSRSFQLSNSNATFNDRVNAQGKFST